MRSRRRRGRSRCVLALLLAGALSALALAGVSAAAPPRLLFVDVDAGPARGGPGGLGVPITLYGTGFGVERGRSTVTIGGREVAAYLAWGGRAANPRLETIVVQPGPGVAAGPVRVEVGGRATVLRPGFSATRGRVLLVAPGGSDGGACGMRSPCATITAALARLRPGDALLVRGPAVADDEVWVRPGSGGRPGLPISILAYPGERPAFTRHDRPVILEGSHVRFAGFAFPNGKALGLGSDAARDDRVVDVDFSGRVDYAAVSTHGDDLLIAGNACRASSSTQGTQGHCYYVSRGRRIRLLANVATGVPGYGIHVFDQQRSADDGRRVIADVLIEGNLLGGSTERSGLILAMGDEGGRGNRIEGVVVRDNVFTASNFAGVVVGGNVSKVVVERNTFVGNGRQGVTVYDDPTIDGVTIRRNLLDQRVNAACEANCSWYARRHVEVGARARRVSVAGNWFAPGLPLLAGARDPDARHGPVAYRDEAGGDLTLLSPAAARGYGATWGETR